MGTVITFHAMITRKRIYIRQMHSVTLVSLRLICDKGMRRLLIDALCNTEALSGPTLNVAVNTVNITHGVYEGFLFVKQIPSCE